MLDVAIIGLICGLVLLSLLFLFKPRFYLFALAQGAIAFIGGAFRQH